jgi:para-nitrobenzyl esterase
MGETSIGFGGLSRRGILAGASVALAAGAAAATSVAQAQPAPAVGGLSGGDAASDVFVIAETAYGKVQGINNGAIAEFKGIPYGAPTGGKNRYMPPNPPAAWTGVRECFGYGQISPQTPADLRSEYAEMIMWDRHVGPGGLGEDVLNLNIWTPGVDHARRPVLVSFHGGGWTTGSGNGPMYDGANLAKFGDVVVVTVNHRLGANGYVHLAGIPGAPSDFAAAGVCGVMDMVASLEWVRDNIAAFGGDPGRVTVAGQSAGATSVSILMASPLAKGLFQRAIAESGGLFEPVQLAPGYQLANAERDGEAYAHSVGATSLADLRALPAAALLGGDAGKISHPVVEPYLMPRSPYDVFAAGDENAAQILIGSNADEARSLIDDLSSVKAATFDADIA